MHQRPNGLHKSLRVWEHVNGVWAREGDLFCMLIQEGKVVLLGWSDSHLSENLFGDFREGLVAGQATTVPRIRIRCWQMSIGVFDIAREIER